MINMSLSESYKRTDVEIRFIELYNKWGWSSTGDPLRQFERLRNPKGLDPIFELDNIDRYLTNRYPKGRYNSKPDDWIRTLQNWLLKSRRGKQSATLRELKMPFYKVKYKEILERTTFKGQRDIRLQRRFERCWKYLTSHIDGRVPTVGKCIGPEQKEYAEKILFHAIGLAEYHRKIRDSLNLFDDELLDYIAAWSPGLLLDILDWMYGPELDRPNIDPSAFEGRFNV